MEAGSNPKKEDVKNRSLPLELHMQKFSFIVVINLLEIEIYNLLGKYSLVV